jgi:hypothetical protein
MTLTAQWLWPERMHGSTRVPGHAFIEWRCSILMTDCCVLYIYYITAARYSITVARSFAAPVRATGTVRKRQAVRTVQNHICRLTLLQPARPAKRAAGLGQPSSLRPYWLWLQLSLFSLLMLHLNINLPFYLLPPGLLHKREYKGILKIAFICRDIMSCLLLRSDQRRHNWAGSFRRTLPQLSPLSWVAVPPCQAT